MPPASARRAFSQAGHDWLGRKQPHAALWGGHTSGVAHELYSTWEAATSAEL